MVANLQFIRIQRRVQAYRLPVSIVVLAVFVMILFSKEESIPVSIALPCPTPVVAGLSDCEASTPPLVEEINEMAPSTKFVAGDAQSYINRYKKTAIAEMQKFGVPASISLAQGLIESRAGSSKLAVNNNNHFGIKCFSRNCKKGHCSNYTDDSHKDFFRKFPGAWYSWREHSKLLSSGRYQRLHKYGRDYRKWSYGLKSVGYATDRTYAQKLIGIIERYNLQKYDR